MGSKVKGVRIYFTSVQGISYADLSGRKVNANSHGLVLMTLKRADGTQNTVKVIKK